MNSNARRAPRTRSSFARRAIGLIVAVVMALGLVVPGSAAAAGAPQQAGLSANPLLGPLSAKWWQWVTREPPSSNPFLSSDGSKCGANQPAGPVFFLAGSFIGPVTRDKCVVPYGKALFFPIVNIASIQTDEGETAQSLWEDVQVDAGWKVTSAKASVNGKPLPFLSARNPLYRGCVGPERGCVPRSFTIDLPDDNIFGVVDPIYELAIADGFYALIPPLPRGEHVIHWEGTANYFGPDAFTQDVTYKIIVA